MTTAELLRALNDADQNVPAKVRAALPAIEAATIAIAGRLDAGGRWFQLGAGTSGRLAVLDASELPPTFGVSPGLVTGLVAGGPRALQHAVEGAEDDAGAAARDLAEAGLSARDVVLGIAASGRTPYVLGAIDYGRRFGALTVGFACAPETPLLSAAELAILVDTGPEVLAGSTRLMAGTAQKLVLNMLSTAVMARRGLVVRGEMVAMRPTNEKLRRRAVRIVSDLLDVAVNRAEELLRTAGWELPVALLAGRFDESPEAARVRLAAAGGSVARALGEP